VPSAPGEPQTLSQVARATGITRAAVRRFLLTLEQLGYVRQRDGRFALTPRVLELGPAPPIPPPNQVSQCP
jgi:IclR family pca regulon transcriptional regulator